MKSTELNDDSFFLLGVPISTSSMSTLVKEISELTQSPKNQYITLLTYKHIRHIYSWNPSVVRNPEILTLLQQADQVASSKQLFNLCRLLGCPLEDKIPVEELIKELINSKKRIFVLGGRQKNKKIELLKRKYPQIELAGVNDSKVIVKGEELLYADDIDDLVIEKIQEAKPEILLIGLGIPKQELWFSRVRQKIGVSVTLGIGKTSNLLTDSEQQNFSEMGKHFLLSLYTSAFIALPLLCYHWVNQWIADLTLRNTVLLPRKSLLFLSPQQTIAMIPLPPMLSEKFKKSIRQQIDEAFSHDVLILDFRCVQHADLHGIQLLFSTWKEAMQRNHPFYILGMTNRIKNLLKLHRAWNFLRDHLCETASDLLYRLPKNGERLYETMQQNGDSVILTFLGKLDHRHHSEAYLQQLTHILSGKTCIIDLAYCSSIDSKGVQTLLKIRDQVLDDHQEIKIRGLKADLRRYFKSMNVYDLFQYEDEPMFIPF